MNFKDEKIESDGNDSDDEAEFVDEIDYAENNQSKRQPTLEEYVKKHVFKRSNNKNLLNP